MSRPVAIATRAVRAALVSDKEHGAVVPPLHLSANFAFQEPGVCGRYDDTRSGNPTRPHLADALADLEGGAGAVVTATRMAAITTVLQLVAPGVVVVAPHDCYGGTQRLLKALSSRLGFDVLWLDQTSTDSLAVAAAGKPLQLELARYTYAAGQRTSSKRDNEAAHMDDHQHVVVGVRVSCRSRRRSGTRRHGARKA